MDGGEALRLNWHADGTDLLTQSTDVGGFFGTRIGEILVIYKINFLRNL